MDINNTTISICSEELSLSSEALTAAKRFLSAVDDDGDEPAVKALVQRCNAVQHLIDSNARKDDDNYWRLLVMTAADIRVVLIFIARQLAMLRSVDSESPTEEAARMAEEARHVYIPISHKLGLYRVKSEMEDLALKYTEHDAYYMIKEKLADTKSARDLYIEQFIGPLSERLTQAGLHFHIKGRTKSIHSIWQKMQKQQCEFEGIYDLFAIRVILDEKAMQPSVLPEQSQSTKNGKMNVLTSAHEKMLCWQAYSVVTDMYPPNIKRLRDWISVPKANGYESLHTTVKGPEQKWVEVQIRTERMDEVAERGVAAHWRYKGVAQGGNIDTWFNQLREEAEKGGITQQATPDSEVYVITPKGDIWNFPQGATVLDFAFRIHTNVGSRCTGAHIDGKMVSVKEQLQNGQHIDIITSNNQQPKQDWLHIVTTQRAKSKIRQALREQEAAFCQIAKEQLERRFKNKKVELVESRLAQTVQNMGFKETTAFYKQIAEGRLDIAEVIEHYLALSEKNEEHQSHNTLAAAYQMKDEKGERKEEKATKEERGARNDDTLLIGKQVKGVEYSLAKCCNPIYGDKVFGFLNSGGGVKIHRVNCPNAPELKEKYPYRIIKAQWGAHGDTQYSVLLRIVGKDSINVVNNITQHITKETDMTLRSINIDSHDGLFKGSFGIQTDDVSKLPALIRRLSAITGVVSVERG